MKSAIALVASVLFSRPVWADLVVTIVGPPSYNVSDTFKFITRITNTGSEDVTLLNTPNSAVAPKFATNIFGVVSDDGIPARFNGIALKWDQESAIAAKDFTVVKARESIEVEQDYSGVYDFSKSGESHYTIDGGNYFQVVSPSGYISTYVAAVKTHTASVIGNIVASVPASESSNSVRRALVSGCTSDQIDSLSSAVPNAVAYVSGALSYLGNLGEARPRYTTWFGAWSATNKASVLSRYSRIGGDPNSMTYDCSTCPGTANRNAYAYVYPNQPTTVYLCAAFWRAPTTGTDSKAGTIVHELSHFDANGGTHDYAYGQGAAAALASSNPARAIMNADNYEYFAENSPSRA